MYLRASGKVPWGESGLNSKKVDPYDTVIICIESGQGIPLGYWSTVVDWIEDFRSELKEERGILLPPVDIFGFSKNIEKTHFRITISGKIVFDEDAADAMEDIEKEKELRRTLYQVLESQRASYDIDWNWCLEQWEAQNTSSAYLKLMNYYHKMERNEKKQFHYAKKLAACGVPRGLRALRTCYSDGYGTEQDYTAERKINILSEGRLLWEVDAW